MHVATERNEPLYAAIKREFLSKIERGIWPVGEQIPTEEELQRRYAASRGTIRRALYELEVDGYISRRSRTGTFVTRTRPRMEKTGEILSFTRQMARKGLDARTRVLVAETIRASAAKGRVQEAFELPSDASVIHIERLRCGNDLPFSVQSVYLRPELVPGILEEDHTHLFRLYEEKYGKKIARADEILQVGFPSPGEAVLLQIEREEPVIIRDRVSFDQSDDAFEVLHSVERPDRFSYRYTIVNDLTELPETADQPASASRRAARRRPGRGRQPG